MAVRTWVTEVKAGGWVIATLSADLGASDTTDNLELPMFPDKTIVLRLVSGSLTDLDFKGSNDGTNFFDLHRLDAPGSTFTDLTASLMAGIVENPRFLKVTAVAGTTPVVEVILVAFTGR